MAPTIVRFLLGALLVGGCVSGCQKSASLSSATIHGRDVQASDLPELTKVVEAAHARLGPWNETVPRDAITIEVTYPKRGHFTYLYSPSKKSILWLEDPKGRKFGCSVSGHSSLTIEKCFERAE